MNEVIDRILEGNFDYEKGSLDFSCSKLELSIGKGECVEGSFKLLGTPGRYTKGYVYSSDSRMECLTGEFVGCEEEIFYCFHGEALEEGDVVRGEFYVVSNQGEYYLPFVVNVEHTVLTSTLGNIKNLFHFANLAKASPEEAVGLFYSKDFERIFNGNDRQFYEYYLGMSVYPGNEQAVEEFLIGINKKQKIEYLADTDYIRLENPEGVVETGVTITRNGWGYTRLQIETEGDFLFTEKEVLSDDDFLGNACRLPVYVDGTLLHGGNNFGSVRLFNAYQEIRVTIMVKCGALGNQGRRRKERQRLVLQLMEFYQAFRLKKIGSSTWIKESIKIVDKMTAADDKDVLARLFQAQLLITGERFNEAQWILEHVADILDFKEADEPVLEAYYLYLTSLIHREAEFVNQVTERVEYIFKRNRKEWQIAWLLLYLSEEYNRSSSKKWMFLEEQFERGCNSPVLYIEALFLLNANPSLLMKLGGFERQVLMYGAKHEQLNQDVVLQFVYLVQKEREFSVCLYRILQMCYAHRPDVQVLQEICSLLIKGNLSGREYFKWYALGVEKELRITRLYEYYLMSVDLNMTEPLPKIVLMYFSYQRSLGTELGAFVYANVHRYRDSFPELYENYRGTIEQFIIEQIGKKRINRDLAYLYKNLLEPRMLTKEVAEALAELIFVHQIELQREDISYVIVYRRDVLEPIYYPVSDSHAFVSLPGMDNTILFEDIRHNRYMVSVPYTMEKLMLPGKLVKLIAPLVENVQDFNIHMCTNGQETLEITQENEFRFKYLLEDDGISTEKKCTIAKRLVQYYYEKDKIRELDECLEALAPEAFSEKDRGSMMQLLVLRGMEEKAFSWLTVYGPFGVEPKVLVRLCSCIIRNTEYVENATLTEAVWYAFRKGKYEEVCLRYLILHFKGLIKDMRDIFKAAVDFDVVSYDLCERLLVQMLFSGAYVGEKTDIFKAYICTGAKAEIEEAFLSQCAYEYFVKDRVTDGFVFWAMAARYNRGESLHKVCKLAFIKYYAENRAELTEETTEVLLVFLHEMLNEHIHLKMFTEFLDLNDPYLNRLLDRTIVEYKAHPKARAVIHYCLETAEGEKMEYLTEEMDEAYGGVCFKEFVLFFGDRLQYYIMEAQDGDEQLTESGTLQRSDTGNAGVDSKFALINDLSISSNLQDYETMDNLLTEYEYKEFLRNGLFKLM